MSKLQDQTQLKPWQYWVEGGGSNKYFENKRLSCADQRTTNVRASVNKGFKTPAAQRFSSLNGCKELKD